MSTSGCMSCSPGCSFAVLTAWHHKLPHFGTGVVRIRQRRVGVPDLHGCSGNPTRMSSGEIFHHSEMATVIPCNCQRVLKVGACYGWGGDSFSHVNFLPLGPPAKCLFSVRMFDRYLAGSDSSAKRFNLSPGERAFPSVPAIPACNEPFPLKVSNIGYRPKHFSSQQRTKRLMSRGLRQ